MKKIGKGVASKCSVQLGKEPASEKWVKASGTSFIRVQMRGWDRSGVLTLDASREGGAGEKVLDLWRGLKERRGRRCASATYRPEGGYGEGLSTALGMEERPELAWAA